MPNNQTKLATLIQFNDRLMTCIGHAVSWTTLLLVLATCLIVVMRYLFNLGSIAIQESLLYMHSLIFLLGAAWTLQDDGHVRVDIFYRPLTARGKAWINLFGSLLLLLPTCGFLLWISMEYVVTSWSYFEGSRESGGLDGVFLLKTLLLVMPAMLILQGISNILHNLLVLRGQAQPETSHDEVTL